MRPVFILGSDDGSRAFLSALLAAHESFVETPQFSGSYLKAAQRSFFDFGFGDSPFSQELEPYLGDYGGTLRGNHGSEAIERLVETYAHDHGRPDATVWLEHVSLSELPLLRATFPAARTLHLVRDGRAVAASRWQHPGEPRRPIRVARTWREGVRRGLEAERTLGEDCLRVSYEALLSDLRGGLEALAQFIGVSVSDFRIAHSVFYKDYTPHLYSWRRQLTLSEIKAFEDVSGPLLTELGYGLEAPGSGLPTRPDLWHRTYRQPLHYSRPYAQPPATPLQRHNDTPPSRKS